MSHINQMSYELTNTSYFIEKMDEVIQWLGKKRTKITIVKIFEI